jgi:parallel beta-helix repeat protein
MKLAAALLTIILAAPAAQVEAQVSCGATITANAVMTADLQCPSHNPAFTVKGPATVDMAGHRILACAGGGVGVVLTGSGATLKNGAVIGSAAASAPSCATAVRVAGKGKHTVDNVVARDMDNAFVIVSGGNTIIRTAAYAVGSAYTISSKAGPADKNKLKDNIASEVYEAFVLEANDGDYYGNIAYSALKSGFDVVGNGNVLRRNKSTNNDEYGFFIDGSFNRLDGNLASENGEGGFFLSYDRPQVGNRLLNNIAVGHEKFGFTLGAEALAMDNVAANNAYGGFQTRVPNVTLWKNTAAGNGDGGIVEGGAGLVKNNRVLANGFGIEVAASGVTVTGNTVIGNLPDLQDDNAMCAGNTWTNNIFATHDPVCTH